MLVVFDPVFLGWNSDFEKRVEPQACSLILSGPHIDPMNANGVKDDVSPNR